MKRLTLSIATAVLLALASGAAATELTGTEPAPGDALTAQAASGNFCSDTAALLYSACRSEVKDDAYVAQAICTNIADTDDREDCFDELEQARAEGNESCGDQREWRLDACEKLGEARYDPEFEPSQFDHPANPRNPNPYFPLKIGNVWEYRSNGDETDRLEVLNRTKLIDDVRCVVVRDTVKKAGVVAEDTDDWYAQAKNGDTWYCGEEVKNYQTFSGDQPKKPELVSIDGSFKAGRGGDKPGIIFLRHPEVDDVYLEEFSLGNAEDVTEVLATDYGYGDGALDDGVPRQLAERFCSHDCVVTKNYSLLEPGVSARKYYARGIGVILEVESEGTVVRLVKCNFDQRCRDLPH